MEYARHGNVREERERGGAMGMHEAINHLVPIKFVLC